MSMDLTPETLLPCPECAVRCQVGIQHFRRRGSRGRFGRPQTQTRKGVLTVAAEKRIRPHSELCTKCGSVWLELKFAVPMLKGSAMWSPSIFIFTATTAVPIT